MDAVGKKGWIANDDARKWKWVGKSAVRDYMNAVHLLLPTPLPPKSTSLRTSASWRPGPNTNLTPSIKP